MVSQLKVNEIIKQSGSSITIGESGDTITLPSTSTLTNFPENTPAFAVKQASGPGISNGISTKATFDTTEFDTDSAFDSTNNRFVVPTGKGGKYYFQGYTSIPGIDAGEIGQLFFQKNNSGTILHTVVRNYLQGTNQLFRMTSSFTIELSEGDFIELFLYQNSGSGQNVTNTFFTGFKLIGP